MNLQLRVVRQFTRRKNTNVAINVTAKAMKKIETLVGV